MPAWAIDILKEQGLAGLVIFGLAVCVIFLTRLLLKKQGELTDLYKFMHDESEDENKEKLAYLNDHIVVMTKAKEAIKGMGETLKDHNTKLDSLSEKITKIETKVE